MPGIDVMSSPADIGSELDPNFCQATMRGRPQVIVDDLERRNMLAQPICFGSRGRVFLTPGVAFLRPVPDEDAAVEFPVEYLFDRRWGPTARPSLLGSWAWGSVRVEELCDPGKPVSAGRQFKDPPNDCG